MEHAINALSNAYDEFVTSASAILLTRDAAGGETTPETEAALANFKDRWELFKASCDKAEDLVESLKRRIAWDSIATQDAAETSAAFSAAAAAASPAADTVSEAPATPEPMEEEQTSGGSPAGDDAAAADASRSVSSSPAATSTPDEKPSEDAAE